MAEAFQCFPGYLAEGGQLVTRLHDVVVGMVHGDGPEIKVGAENGLDSLGFNGRGTCDQEAGDALWVP